MELLIIDIKQSKRMRVTQLKFSNDTDEIKQHDRMIKKKLQNKIAEWQAYHINKELMCRAKHTMLCFE